MTREQKERIAILRGSGFGYRKIGSALSLSVYTVKSFCQRHPNKTLKTEPTKDAGLGNSLCKNCGSALKGGRRAKKFCSAACRLSWWNRHPELVDRKAVYCLACAFCGKQFESYGNKGRKFCSRACYGQSRRKAAKHGQA